MQIISALGWPTERAQETFGQLLQGQCWARFAGGFVQGHSGAVPSETEVMEIVQLALEKCIRLLPVRQDLNVMLFPQGEVDWLSRFARTQMHGVSGLTPGADLCALRIGLEEGWQEALADALAHEYHHAAWIALRPDIDRNADLPLAELLAFEGRACVFARRVTGGWIAPWTAPLNDKDFERRVRQVLCEDGAFTPGPDAPPWWVYRLGTAWVKAALAASAHLTPLEWTMLDGDKALP